MTKQPEPEFVAQTLAWCNRQRKKKGKKALNKLPKGFRHDGSSCPCGKATGLFVGLTCYYKSKRSHRESGKVPPSVTQFVRQLDSGKLPQYEAKA